MVHLVVVYQISKLSKLPPSNFWELSRWFLRVLGLERVLLCVDDSKKRSSSIHSYCKAAFSDFCKLLTRSKLAIRSSFRDWFCSSRFDDGIFFGWWYSSWSYLGFYCLSFSYSSHDPKLGITIPYEVGSIKITSPFFIKFLRSKSPSWILKICLMTSSSGVSLITNC